MSYKIIRSGIGGAIEQPTEQIDQCNGSGGTWDYGIGGCICKSGSEFDPVSNKCLPTDPTETIVPKGWCVTTGGYQDCSFKDACANSGGTWNDSLSYCDCVSSGSGKIWDSYSGRCYTNPNSSDNSGLSRSYDTGGQFSTPIIVAGVAVLGLGLWAIFG